MWPAGRKPRGYRHTARRTLLSLVLLLVASVACPAGAQVQTSGNESWSRRLANSHFQRAVALEQRGDIAQALREYMQTIATDGTHGEAYLRLGALRERMGDAREAELIYSEAVRFGDVRARALVQRSHLYRAAGRSVEAVGDLEAAIELEANQQALQELAQHYVEAHAWAAALATFRRIASSAQDSATSESARLEIRALRVLVAEVDPTTAPVKRHDWVGRSLAHLARR